MLRMIDHNEERPSDAEGEIPRSRYGRWRAGTLILVYVLMGVHILHWRLAGKTLAPLELNEVMYTFELGVVTIGFIFMATTVLATITFGRFFCSWGCHILALQDLCSWILRRLGVKPTAIRSRLLLWVPVVAALYMFVWPQAVRLWEGRPAPGFHQAEDADGWASFVTEDFWRNLPGPGIIVLTFAVCGFVIVYVLGSRGFCVYGCPYGAVFRLVDPLAPGRIRVGDDCRQCGTCTSVCTSNVRVHEEVNRYGMVIDPACMKDLDCVSACPQQTLRFGFGRPAIFKTKLSDIRVRKHFDFALWEELLMGGVLLAVLIVYRGLYDCVPFLMTIALGCIVAYLCVVLVRLAARHSVKLNRWQLKSQGRLLPRGRAFIAAMVAFGLLTIHSGLIRYHDLQGRRDYRHGGTANAEAASTDRAIEHFKFVDRWGLLKTDRTVALLADLCARDGRWQEAEAYYSTLVQRRPANVRSHVGLGKVRRQQDKREQALDAFRTALDLNPRRPETHYVIAGLLFEMTQPRQALHHLEQAVQLDPDYAEAHYDLGVLLVEMGQFEKGIAHLRRTIELKPDFADAHYNLSVALSIMGRLDEAIEEVNLAYARQPNDRPTRELREHLLALRSQANERQPPTSSP